MTAESLNALTRKELADKARRRKIGGWHGMTKQALVQALLAANRKHARRNGKSADTANGRSNGSRLRIDARNHVSAGVSRSRRDALALNAAHVAALGEQRDHLVAEVCDDNWVHVRWQITPRMIARAKTALRAEWHRSVPVIRVSDVTRDDAALEQARFVKDVDVSGDVDTWYVQLEQAERTYCFQIGLRGPNGEFFMLARSHRVTMPRAGASPRLDRRNGSSHRTLGNGCRSGEFGFEIDAELIVHGTTHPRARLTLLGEPVPLAADGSFSLRVSLPEGRQVIPAVTVTPGGAEQRTIVLAIERNTKQLDPEPLTDE